MSDQRVALVTGAARRIGAVIATTLHAAGYRVVIHCRRSREAAEELARSLNGHRPDSAVVITADLASAGEAERLIRDANAAWGRLDLLVNNASAFYPSPVGETTAAMWDDLMASNMRAPFFLCQAAAPGLAAAKGAIVNIIDVHAERPLENHAVYVSAKAGLRMLTRALAKDLGPDVRVNGVAPGAILWPESGVDDAAKERIIADTPLKRTGSPEDVADAVLFLANSSFVTGQILAVDGGRSL